MYRIKVDLRLLEVTSYLLHRYLQNLRLRFDTRFSHPATCVIHLLGYVES